MSINDYFSDMRKILIYFILTLPLLSYSQSSDCNNAEDFCTGTNYSFPASTNTTAPIGPDYGCLGTQPNPAFYAIEIDQPGDLTITMQSTPQVDIDFICWGPFNDPTTMCDSLTGAYIEDCSYSTAAIEDCNITNAVTGQHYILLITNYSNTVCNIDFANSGGVGTTNCCTDGDAGLDNTVSFCESDGIFILENELNGTPSTGGVWQDSAGSILPSNSFNPASLINATFTYLVSGTPIQGSSATCPQDTAFLTISSNPNPVIGFPATNDLCSDDQAITLLANPTGGIYSGNGLIGNLFSPNTSVIGNNSITYSFTDLNGCSSNALQNIQVNETPIISLGNDIITACNSSCIINPLISGGTIPYSYLWNSGNTDSIRTLFSGIYSVTVSDAVGCSSSDEIEVISELPPSIELGDNYEIPCNTSVSLSPNSVNGTQPLSYLWSNGSTNSSINVSEGNYSLTVTDTAGCSDFDIIDISEANPGNVNISSTIPIICQGASSIITFNFNGLLPWDLIFTDGNTERNILSNNSSTFTYLATETSSFAVVEARDIHGCIANATDSVDVTVNPLPIPIIEPSFYEIYPGEEITLLSEDYAYYEWYTNSDSLISVNEQLIVDTTLTVYLIVESAEGCVGKSSNAIIKYIQRVEIYIPNAFTPNGDEHNDLLVTIGNQIEKFEIIISNRWGEVIFISNDINKYWDGKFKSKAVPEGSYSYLARILGKDQREFMKAGTVNLIY